MMNSKKQFKIKFINKILDKRYKNQPDLKSVKKKLFLRQIEQISNDLKNKEIDINSLSSIEQTRWSRQLQNPLLNQKKIKDAKITVFGLGGIGTNVLMNLVYSGVSNFYIIDYDKVELSNLNRQTLYTPKDIGKPKTESTQEKLLEINPEIKIEKYNIELNYPKDLELLEISSNEYPENVVRINSIISESDYVINAMDYKGAPYLINDLCVKNRKSFYWGGINYFLGETYSYSPSKRTPCLRDIFASKDIFDTIPFLRYKTQNKGDKYGYSLGLVAIIIGSIMSNLIIFDINDIDYGLHGCFLIYDAHNIEIIKVPIKKLNTCLCNKYKLNT
ncbi:MAG: HesA/MoeB/ThiF family protein [Promethearchaeati archaeon]